MRCVVQRVREASVTIDDKLFSSIKAGIAVFVAYEESDDDKVIEQMCDKLINLRIFEDDNGKLNLSLADVGGQLLLVSNFTLYGDASHGRRPSFTRSARGEISRPLYEKTIEMLFDLGIECKTGVFGADMKVSLVNDGPVTIIIDKEMYESR